MLPKPPVKTMTDFVVFCFVSIVVITILASVIGLFVVSVLDPEGDRSNLVGTLADVMTTLIGALVGFIAGKGQGRSEVHDEIGALDQAQKAEDRRIEQEKSR